MRIYATEQDLEGKKLLMKKGDPSASASALVQSPALSVLLMEVEKLLREKEQGLGKSC